jgi:hypothetical protein
VNHTKIFDVPVEARAAPCINTELVGNSQHSQKKGGEKIMKKLLTTLVCLSGLALTATSAHAITFNVNAGSDAAGSTGNWLVTFTTADYLTWAVTATAGVPAPGSAVPTFADQIQFRILDKTSPTQVPFNLVFAPLTGTTSGGAWLGAGITTAAFSPNTVPARLQNSGGDTFMGSFVLSGVGPAGVPSAGTIGTVEARLSGAGQSWYGFTNLTPEMPGVALLLPALLPFGMILGKKGAFRKSAA